MVKNDYMSYFESNKKQLEEAYFDGNIIEGIKTNNNVKKNYENSEIVAKRLNNGLIDEIVVAWKAGRLVEKEDGSYEPQEKKGNYLNGYGREINKEILRKYIEYIKSVLNSDELSNMDTSDIKKIEEVYAKCIDTKIKIPDNFGTVYIINLLYFRSKRKLPIYDKFAHIAVKSLLMGKRPDEVYVGPAPDREKVSQVVAMYSEYIWLLTEVFGHADIDRETDRALWAYGHAGKNFKGV